MYTISKEFAFSASHILNGLVEGHPCGRLHGHNYVVIVELQSNKLDESGFVLDYKNLDWLKQFIDNTLDHRHLNDVMVVQTSAENIAKWLYMYCKASHVEVVAVTVQETPKTRATYREH